MTRPPHRGGSVCEGGGHPLSQHHLSLWRAEAGGHGASSTRLPSPLPTAALLVPATHPQDAFPEAWERRGSRQGFQALRAHCCLPCSRHLSVCVVMVPPPAAHRMGCDSRPRRSNRGEGARFSHGSSSQGPLPSLRQPWRTGLSRGPGRGEPPHAGWAWPREGRALPAPGLGTLAAKPGGSTLGGSALAFTPQAATTSHALPDPHFN